MTNHYDRSPVHKGPRRRCGCPRMYYNEKQDCYHPIDPKAPTTVTPFLLHQAKKKAQAALDEYNGLVEDYMRQQTDAEVARLLEGE